MKLHSILLTIIAVFLCHLGFSQIKSITGVIKDGKTNETLPGVTIQIKGTTKGAITDTDGKYKIESVSPSDSLVFSYIGYKKQVVEVGNNTEINIQLVNEAELLDEVVITALGIKREKRTIGYAMQEIKAKDIESIKSVNFSSELAGKIAGLKVSSTNAGPGASTDIVLRGLSSLKNNQAMIVVDGIPFSNNTNNTADEWGGKDYGNGIGDINPEDIESVSVLKGASASALYGSKALNGVIMITTKRGKSKKEIGVTFNTSYSFDFPYFHYDMQDKYGAGRSGKFIACWDTINGVITYNAKSASAYGSWGPAMNGQTITDWDGQTKAFIAEPDNYKKIYNTGYTSTNSVAIEGGSDNTLFRFSYTNLMNEYIVPNTKIKRHNFNFSLNNKSSEKTEFDFNIIYSNTLAENRLGLSNDAIIPRNYIMMPRHISDASLKDYMLDENGNENTWYTNWGWMRNPYWMIDKEKNKDQKDRIMASTFFKYWIVEKLSAKLRIATDYYIHDFDKIGAYQGIYNMGGSAANSWDMNFLRTADFLINYNNVLTEHIQYNLNFGGSIEAEKYETAIISSDGNLIIPEFYNPLFSEKTTLIEYKKSQRELQSLYGFGQISYKNLLFFDVTGRNDWSSTLSANRNSYFYPSFSLAFIFSELLSSSTQKIVSYGKIRASIAGVGGDADPHKINKSYIKIKESYNNLSLYSISKTIPPIDLKPEMKSSKELGTEMYFFGDRIAFDFTYYYTLTKNQILDVDISQTTGFQRATINAGKILNTGIELQLKGKNIRNKNFIWETTLNYAKNKNEVLQLTDQVKSKNLRNHWTIAIESREGHPIGDIVGYGIKRDANGNKLVDSNGLYLRTDSTVVLGNTQPKWIGGISNSFTYKNISLSFLVEFSMGGEMYSGTNMYGHGYSGNFKETLKGREEWYESEKQRIAAGVSPQNWVATGGYLAEGVFEDGSPNNVYLDPQKYWSQFSEWTKEIHEPFIYDASYIKLREITLSYNLPKKYLPSKKISGIAIAIFTKNLWLIYSKVPNIDPESQYTNDVSQGLELYSYPAVRNFGFNIRIQI